MSATTFSVRYQDSIKWVRCEQSIRPLVETIKNHFDMPPDENISLVMERGNLERDIFDDEDLSHVEGGQLVVYRNHPNQMVLMVGKEEYSLDKIPHSYSSLVKVAVDVVLPGFKVPEFVVGLGNFAKKIRLTNLHLLAANKLKLHCDLHEFAKGIIPLTEHSMVTLATFEKTCQNILELLLGIFQYWQEGLFEQSLTNLESLRQMVADIRDECGGRLEEVESVEKKSSEFILKIREERIDTCNKVDDKSKAEELEKEKEKLVEYITVLLSRVEENRMAQATARSAEENLDSLKPASDASMLSNFMWWFQSLFPWTEIGQKINVLEETKKTATESEFARSQADEKKRKQEKVVLDQTTEIDDLAKAEKYTLMALQTMETLSLTLTDMHTFWEMMERAINELSKNHAFLTQMEKASKLAENLESAVINRLLRSVAFKRQGITYMARFVAIRDISDDCRRGMVKVKRDVDLFRKETVSKEDAQAMIENRDLMRELHADCTYRMVTEEINEPVLESGESSPEGARMAFQMARQESVNGYHVTFDAVQPSD